MSRGTRAKTDRIDAELIARFMLFRPEVGRTLPSDNLRILRALTTRRTQIVDMRKRLLMQITAREKQGISADIEDMDDALKALHDTRIGDIESRIESVIAQEKTTAVKANLLRSIPGIAPVLAAMLIAEMPELGRMISGEAAAIIGLAPVSHDSGVMRGKRAIAGRRRVLQHVLFQAMLTAAYHNPILKPAAKRLEECGKPHKLVIVAIAILKTGEIWWHQPGG
jgi:transposase